MKTKGDFAPPLEKDIKKNFEWWEAEHDRAAWEGDQVSEQQKQKWREEMQGLELQWWWPGDTTRPYHENLKSWRLRSTTLPK
ncbi:MAG: hypothetical protein [Microviridae sp.]|nr:MAG: hypothetical protein [Microviridae sp.]